MKHRLRSWLDSAQILIRKNKIKIRFLFAGGFNTLFGLAAFPALYFILNPLGFHYLKILAISYAICIVEAYLVNKLLVFKTLGNYTREFMRFVVFYLGYFLVNLAVLPIFVEYCSIQPVLGQIIIVFVLFISSYFWHSRFTFSNK